MTKTIAYVCLLIFVAHPTLSFGCRPIAGREYKVPTKEERYAQADLVVSGTIMHMKKAPDMEGVPGQHPYTFVVTLEVEKWVKGSGERKLDVFDTTGTDCDYSFGIHHLATEERLESSRWLLYVRRYQGRYWVITAERLK